MPVAATPPKELSDVHLGHDIGADTQIREGYPVAVAVRLQEVLDLTDAKMADILGRSRRTCTRYRNQDKRLGVPESERLFRYLRLLAQAENVFGTREKAAWWMSDLNAALDGRTPVEVAHTAPGAVIVEEVLAGIEHGLPL